MGPRWNFSSCTIIDEWLDDDDDGVGDDDDDDDVDENGELNGDGDDEDNKLASLEATQVRNYDPLTHRGKV